MATQQLATKQKPGVKPQLSPYNPRALFFFAFVGIPWLLYLIVIGLLMTLALPIKLFFPNTLYNLSSKAAYSVWSAVRYIFCSMNGAKITVSGDKLPQGESAVVIANHLSWTDFYLIQEAAVQTGMLGRCRYFAKKSLIWVPGLGLGLYALGCPLISRTWLQDKKELDKVFEGFTRNKWPVWLISYNEGTRLTPKKLEEASKWCKENGKAIPKYTLHPRTKGFVSTVNHLRQSPQVVAVYDVTLAYSYEGNFLETPTMVQSMTHRMDKFRFHTHVERFLIKDLPSDEDELKLWLEQRWMEKNKTLTRLKEKLERGEEWTTDFK